jgi:hypothetical protein
VAVVENRVRFVSKITPVVAVPRKRLLAALSAGFHLDAAAVSLEGCDVSPAQPASGGVYHPNRKYFFEPRSHNSPHFLGCFADN